MRLIAEILTSIFLCCAIAVPTQSHAQNQVEDFLKKIRLLNAGKTIVYDYKMGLFNKHSGKTEDSVRGRLYKMNSYYLDSNSSIISGISDRYYYKVDLVKRSFILADLSVLSSKYGIDSKTAQPSVFDFSDSFLVKYAKLATEKLPNGNFRFTLSFKRQDISRIIVELDQNSLLMTRLEITREERDKYNESTGYIRIYTIENIKHQFSDDLISPDRFFKESGATIALSPKYNKYSLINITK